AAVACMRLSLSLWERKLRQSEKGTSAEVVKVQLCRTAAPLLRIPRSNFHLRCPGNKQAISGVKLLRSESAASSRVHGDPSPYESFRPGSAGSRAHHTRCGKRPGQCVEFRA